VSVCVWVRECVFVRARECVLCVCVGFLFEVFGSVCVRIFCVCVCMIVCVCVGLFEW